MDTKERNQRIYNLLRNKINYLFKSVLSDIEEQTKKFSVDSRFFSKKTNGKPEGFYAIRKTLFTHGNDIITLFDLILKDVSVLPSRGTVEVSESVFKQIEDENKQKYNKNNKK